MSKNKKVKYLPGIGLVRTEKESKILPDCGEKQSCNACEKAAECRQKKVESEADEFKKKYPEIAKMTVAEVVATNLFTVGLRQAITSYRVLNYYAFSLLDEITLSNLRISEKSISPVWIKNPRCLMPSV